MCGLCPARGDCLAWALNNDAYGLWAGTSRFQRLQLTRDRHRARCPGCGSPAVIDMGRDQVCSACGISWKI